MIAAFKNAYDLNVEILYVDNYEDLQFYRMTTLGIYLFMCTMVLKGFRYIFANQTDNIQNDWRDVALYIASLRMVAE